METTQTVPYKIGKVSFVPSGGLAAVSKEVLTVSDMNSNNCVQIFQFDQNTIQRTWSSPTESKVTDVQWVSANKPCLGENWDILYVIYRSYHIRLYHLDIG